MPRIEAAWGLFLAVTKALKYLAEIHSPDESPRERVDLLIEVDSQRPTI
jgi:hypothetical protein